MIRVYAITDTLDSEGGLTLVVTGHASEKVCAAGSMLWATMLMGYEALALRHPREVRFEHVERAKPNASPLPVASVSKKKTRR